MSSRHYWDNFPQHVQTPLSQKLQTFSEIVIAFLQYTQNFENLEKKDQIHSVNISEVIQSEKCDCLSAKSSCFRTPFVSPRVPLYQTLAKSARQNLYPKFLWIQDKLSKKTSLSVRSEILGMFGNTLTVDHMYFRHNWEKLPQEIQTPLSQKPQTFSGIFITFLQSRQIFAHYEEES